MDKWELICSKVSGLEEELFDLEDQYRKEQQAIEDEREMYHNRYNQFRNLLEAKYEYILFDFKEREIEEYQQVTNLVETYFMVGEQQFITAFRTCDQRLEDLEADYKKKRDVKEQQLTEAYAERSRINFELLDEGK